MPHDRLSIYEEINQYWENVSSVKEATLISETYFKFVARYGIFIFSNVSKV